MKKGAYQAKRPVPPLHRPPACKLTLQSRTSLLEGRSRRTVQRARLASSIDAAHRTVAHTLGEYVSKDGEAHTQTVESFFAILKRGVMGSFHSVSEQHLSRYLDEFAFRWDNRSSMGVEDAERARRMVKGAIGKRLTYQLPNSAKAVSDQAES